MTNRGKPYRKKAAKLFDTEVYRYGGLVEGIFDIEETKGHRLYCRYTKRVYQIRFE